MSFNILNLLKLLVNYNASWHYGVLNDQDMIIDCCTHVQKISSSHRNFPKCQLLYAIPSKGRTCKIQDLLEITLICTPKNMYNLVLTIHLAILIRERAEGILCFN